MEEVSDTSVNDTMDDVQSFLDMELEALKSIYINEINVEEVVEATNVSIDLYPATADKLDQQYVRITLQFVLSDRYPDDIPKIQIRNPRGLSEEKLNSIMKELLTIAETKKGNSMLFEMIEAAKEYLTTGNRPCGECAICLYGFSDSDIFTKTECYHYFHSHCLARYAKNFKEPSEDDADPKSECNSDELLCPMCRVPITFSGCEEEFPPPEASDESSFELNQKLAEMQNKMAQLFQKQVEKGGIIDIEAEKNKYLIEISNVPTRVSNGDKPAENTIKCKADDSLSDDASTPQPESSEQVDSPVKERGSFRGQKQKQNFRGRNQNYKYSSENQGNQNRRDGRYNKHSFNDSRGYQYRGADSKYSDRYEQGYRRYPNNRLAQKESSEIRDSENSLPTGEVDDSDFHNSSSVGDDASGAAEEQRRENKYKHKFSPRHNRGYMRRGNSNAYYDGRARPDRYRYLGRQNSNESDRCNLKTNDEDTAVSEELDQKERTPYDGNRKFNYRYNRPSYENGRFQGNRNAQRGTRRGYGKRDNYYDSKHNMKDSYKKYEPKQRGGSRGWGFQEREQFRDNRPKYDYSDASRPQSSRNSTRDVYNKHSEECPADSLAADVCEGDIPRDNGPSQVCVKHEVQGKASGSNSCQTPFVKESVNPGKDLPCFSHESSSEICEKLQAENGLAIPAVMKEKPHGSLKTVYPPPGFANPMKKVIYGLQGANPPPGFNINRS